MKISKIIPESYIDYEKGLSTVLFVPNCNYNCGPCHAKRIVSNKEIYEEEEVIDYIKRRKKFVDKIVISGGEPTIEKDLIEFIKKLKRIGLEIKLDTNGSNPDILRELKENQLVDYVAMDVKGPIEIYPPLIGKDNINEDDLKLAINLVSQFPDYEFRTTLFPILEGEKIRWMTPEEILKISKWIYQTTGSNEHKYFLQPFIAPKKEEVIDERFSKENLPPEFHKTPKKHLENCLIEAQKYLPYSKIR